MPCAQRERWPMKLAKLSRLQAGDQRLVHIDAVPAAGMELERGLAILGDADAAEAVGFLQRLAPQHGGRAAEEGGVPLVEAALDDAVEHLVLGRHASGTCARLRSSGSGLMKKCGVWTRNRLLFSAKYPTVSCRKLRAGA